MSIAVERRSILSGIKRTMMLDITEEQLKDYTEGNGLIQDAFPNLTPSEREFIKTGIVDSEWDEAFMSSEEEMEAFVESTKE